MPPKKAPTSTFKVFDQNRRNQHEIDAKEAIKISEHRLAITDGWVRKGTSPAKPSGVIKRKKTPRKSISPKSPSIIPSKSATKTWKKKPKTVSDIVDEDEASEECLYCRLNDREPGGEECGPNCYTAFHAEHLLGESAINIKALPSKALGYGAFTKPRVTILAGDWLDEYLGDLTPYTLPVNSAYVHNLKGTCNIDSGKAGNWTRFINSSCYPNLECETEWVGKRKGLFFQAKRDIGPEEELTFFYGAGYFDRNGIECRCGVSKKAHMPQLRPGDTTSIKVAPTPGKRKAGPKNILLQPASKVTKATGRRRLSISFQPPPTPSTPSKKGVFVAKKVTRSHKLGR